MNIKNMFDKKIDQEEIKVKIVTKKKFNPLWIGVPVTLVGSLVTGIAIIKSKGDK